MHKHTDCPAYSVKRNKKVFATCPLLFTFQWVRKPISFKGEGQSIKDKQMTAHLETKELPKYWYIFMDIVHLQQIRRSNLLTYDYLNYVSINTIIG